MSDPNIYRPPAQQAYGRAYQPPLPVPYQPPAPVPYQHAAIGPYTTHPPLVSAGGRIGAALLDVLLAAVTLWIGWFVWSMVTWSDGQTPAKKLLGHVVADEASGLAFGWGQMAMRELCVKGLLGWVLNVCTFSIYTWVDAFSVFGDRQRSLHDRMARSIVRHS